MAFRWDAAKIDSYWRVTLKVKPRQVETGKNILLKAIILIIDKRGFISQSYLNII